MLTIGLPHIASAGPTVVDPAFVAANADDPTAYKLCCDDQFTIAVFNHPEFTSSATLLSDGTFDYYNTRIRAAGLTLAQLTTKLTKLLVASGQLTSPTVTVTVTQVAATVSVVGDVKLPGRFPCKTNMHVLDALADGEGLAQTAQFSKITLMKAGAAKGTSIDAIKLFGGDSDQNLPVGPQDIVMVEARDPNDIDVNLSGEVAHPGQYTVSDEGAPVFSVLSDAGGPTAAAALSRVQIIHDKQVRQVDLRSQINAPTADITDARVYPGDLVVVPTNDRKVLVLGEVKAPSVYMIPDGDTLTLSEAITIAGGFTPDAVRPKVELIRSTDGGDPTITTIDMTTYLTKGNADIVLKPKDLVFVPSKRQGMSSSQSFGAISALGGLVTVLRFLSL
jgi:protein involved in polysaccharide export with SLBB domain